MNIIIRVDSSLIIGTGHVYRCLILADELKNKGHNITFLSIQMLNHLKATIIKKGHAIKIIDTDSIDGPNCLKKNVQHNDASSSILFIKELPVEVDWLVVDCYHLDISWESQLKRFVKKILVIDDLANRKHNCDLLLDANYYIDMENRYLDKAQNSKMLLGPKYFLIRDDFRKYQNKKYNYKNTVKRILIFFGGVDKNNLTNRVLEALINIKSKLIVDVVVGDNNLYKDDIKLLCKKFKFNFHKQPDNYSDLLSKADISISAGGVALYERLFLQIPTFAITCADNQVSQVRDLASECFIYSFDNKSDYKLASLENHILSFIENTYLRKYMHNKCKNFIDGMGIFRILAAMGISQISIREAVVDDELNIFKWRNEKNVRNASFDNAKIKRTDHKKWFKSILNDKDKSLVIAFYENEPVGVVKIVIDENYNSTISIYKINQNIYVRGLDILLAAENWFLRKFPKIKMFVCKILYQNYVSLRMFEHAGYQIQNSVGIKKL